MLKSKPNADIDPSDGTITGQAMAACDERRASLFSRLLFSWVYPLIKLGHSRPLVENDIPSVLTRDQVRSHLEDFEKHLQHDYNSILKDSHNDDGDEKKRSDRRQKNKAVLLGGIIWKSFGRGELVGILLKLISDAAMYVPPLCISRFVQYAEDPTRYGTVYGATSIFLIAAVNLLAPLVTGFSNQWWHHRVMLRGLHARTALQAAIYSKLLRLRAPGDTIVNAQSTDCRMVEYMFHGWFFAWSMPLQIVITSVLMYQRIGWPIFVGLLAVVGLALLQRKILATQLRLTKNASASSDSRIKLIRELIQSASVVKANAWEDHFRSEVGKARDAELADRGKAEYLQAFNSSIAEIANVAAMLITFGVHAAFVTEPEDRLTPERVFSTIALFGTLKMPIELIPILVTIFAGGLVSTKRIAEVLYAPELQSYVAVRPADAAPVKERQREHVLKVEGGTTFIHGGNGQEQKEQTSGYDQEQKKQSSCDDGVELVKQTDHTTMSEGDNNEEALNPEGAGFALKFESPFCLKPGSFTVVTGRIGSGKSSLLSAILGEMQPVERTASSAKSKGSEDASDRSLVHIFGEVAYCAQLPWIQNGSLRENVLFGREYDGETYEEVIRVCALEPDLKSLPAGDATEIGERGINLSGGQKARVALARACYSNATILILDDVLSAVDAHVAKHITEECMLGYLKEKHGRTVLLATHQGLTYSKSDRFVFLDKGRIIYDGSYDGAQRSNAMKLSDAMMGKSLANMLKTEKFLDRGASVVGLADLCAAKEREEDDERMVSGNETTACPPKQADAEAETHNAGTSLTSDEEKETGSVRLNTYLDYVSMVGYGSFVTTLCLIAGANAQGILSNWWLSLWTDASSQEPDDISAIAANYVPGYIGLGISVCAFIFLFRIVFVRGNLRAGAKIHDRMILAILTAPQSFFDTTLTGRLLNLFTADMKAVDEEVVQALSEFFHLISMLLSVVVLVIVVVPLSAAAIAPLFVAYYFIQKVYRSSSRELKRFDSTTQSPIFNHFSETFAGLSTIRAFRCESRMLGESNTRIDYNTRFWLMSNLANRWLGMRLDFIGASLAGLTALACVIAIYTGHHIDPGLVGLILSYVTLFTSLLNYGVRNMSEAEQSLVAIERTRQLALTCPQETTKDPLDNVPDTWPSTNGEIVFTGVSARYRSSLPLAINGLDLVVPPRSRVGVCGATGSGKSTLARILFRILEVEEGSVTVDGLDAACVDLSVLRSRMTMISQDPVLFAGPLRHSLDPAGVRSDEELLNAIKAVGAMSGFVGTEEGGVLDSEIDEGGDNISAGQRQLICMARALLHKTRILVMDEATSSMDAETDILIQKMLKDNFRDCTVITIAHRLDTILDYDHVIVMDKGKVAEAGPPCNLLMNEDGEFAKLVENQNHETEMK